MWLAYIDETYEVKNQFWLIALIVPATYARMLEGNLDKVVKEANRKFPEINPNAELHGYNLDAAKEDWSALFDKRQALGDIFIQAINAICEIPEIYIVRAGINLQRAYSSVSNDPHRWALKFLLEQIDGQVQLLQKKENNIEQVLAICDHVGQNEKYRKDFHAYRLNGTGGQFPCYLNSFIDSLHFAPSKYSRLIQAADLVAYVFRRANFVPPRNPKARKYYENLWKKIENSIEQVDRYWPK